MQGFFIGLMVCIVLSVNLHAKSPQERLYDCTRADTDMDKMMCETLRDAAKELHAIQDANNAWLGTYSLKKNLYTGDFTIERCNADNMCKASYSALLDKSEFNDLHECDMSLILEIQSPQEAIAYDEELTDCKIYIKKSPQGIVFTRDEKAFNAPDSFCNTMCGNQTIFEWGDVYRAQ